MITNYREELLGFKGEMDTTLGDLYSLMPVMTIPPLLWWAFESQILAVMSATMITVIMFDTPFKAASLSWKLLRFSHKVLCRFQHHNTSTSNGKRAI